ncbi:hypothetical protein GKQ23_02065 [Erwinia sp. E602]|uniref:hypothetical protein n=1 Tax=unclassified Erwinia TaxID=2622719 RepID=UPI0006F4FDF5|nr:MULTISPECIES: hypothetical protein [unclassified Erwinia]KQN53763.1 hypothetical protein ASF13_13680 [Erwinia sp. Leaf53]QUG73861.1 hypothetical protein GKQ23_02065 [Erwinia sp. E602]
MPLSPDTTDTIDMEAFCAWLDRRLKHAAEVTAKEKLASGEYVMFKGRPVPASLLAEEAAIKRARQRRKAAG